MRITREGFFTAIDRIVVPFMILSCWTVLVLTSEVHGVAVWFMGLGFLLVVLLYVTYRELRVHAAASRMAAGGEPDELLKLADREIARRFTRRGKVPFLLYRSIALELRGDRDGARTALADPVLADARRSSWTVLLAAQKIGLAADAGDAGTAREALEGELRPALQGVRSAGGEVIAAESEARVLYAEGKLDEARAIFEKLGKDIRLGQATRALCKHYIGRCLAATDPKASDAAFADAARLAPKTWMARKDQKRPNTDTPT